ncbi:DEAD/DEAH box helicase, partial [Bradyrhizobium sp. AS23.2]
DRERSHEPREARGEARHAPEARHASEAKHSSEARHAPEPRRGSRPQANTSHVPSIGRPEPRRQREVDTEPGDHSHLPAFLLRPVRSPAGA